MITTAGNRIPALKHPQSGDLSEDAGGGPDFEITVFRPLANFEAQADGFWRVSWMGWYIFGNLLPNPATNAWDRRKILLLTGDFFEELKKTGQNQWKSLDFALSKQYHPTFFRSHLKICAGPKQTFQYNPMTVPGAIRMMQKPSEIRPLLQFVATQVFQS